MQKLMKACVLAALPAMILSACNGQSGSSAAGAGSVLPAAGHSSVARIAPNDINENGYDLHGGGATFPAFAYNGAVQPVGSATNSNGSPNASQAGPAPGSLFAEAPTTHNIYYCLTGSGAGRADFVGNTTSSSYLNPTGPCAGIGAAKTGFGARRDPLDFAASDVALASTDYTTYKANREPATGTTWGEPFEFPTIGGPIVYAYRTQDFPKVKHIQFSEWTMCAVANGTVTDWNDPAITADNGGVSVTGGVSRPLTFYYRTDGSGTSFLFTYHLASVCKSSWPAPYNAAPYASSTRNAAWTYGYNQTWPGPTGGEFQGENGNPAVLGAIQAAPYSTGYVEGAYARAASRPAVSQVLQQNYYGLHHVSKKKFIDPTNITSVEEALNPVTAADITYGGGSDEVPLGTSRPDCVLYIDPKHFGDVEDENAYPIVGLSYLLFYSKNNHTNLADKIALAKYMVSAKASAIVASEEYVPLEGSIHTAVLNAIEGKGKSASAGPCIGN